jgi:RecJ-like exonuclease
MTELYDCSKCNGRGSVVVDGEDWMCDKCDGWGELDWIEQITGKNLDNIDYVTEYRLRD